MKKKHIAQKMNKVAYDELVRSKDAILRNANMPHRIKRLGINSIDKSMGLMK